MGTQDINTSPAYRYAVGTPGAGIQNPQPRGFYFAAAGTLTVEGEDGVQADFANVAAGSVLPIAAVRVLAAPAGTVFLY